MRTSVEDLSVRQASMILDNIKSKGMCVDMMKGMCVGSGSCTKREKCSGRLGASGMCNLSQVGSNGMCNLSRHFDSPYVSSWYVYILTHTPFIYLLFIDTVYAQSCVDFKQAA